jgi:hypothetical protein
MYPALINKDKLKITILILMPIFFLITNNIIITAKGINTIIDGVVNKKNAIAGPCGVSGMFV